jgi:ankyrin repeat protein
MRVAMHRVRFTFCAGAAWLVLAAASVASAQSPLADAVEKRDSVAVGALLQQQEGINAAQPDGMTALHWAAHYDDADMVKLLLAAGASAQQANRYGVTPLSLACTNGGTAIVELLLDAGADPNAVRPSGEAALMTASRTGRIGPVEALVARGADVDARDEHGQTALMWAAADGHLEVVESLLDRGADFHRPLSSGFTPLFFAVREGRTNVVLRLLQAGADVNEVMRPKKSELPDAHESTPLILATETAHFELAAALLRAGADPNAHPFGYAALHAVTSARKPIRGDGNPPPIGSGNISSLEIVDRLVAHGADVNVRLENGVSELGRFTTTGSTPFLMAARASDIPLMKLLLKLGADSAMANADRCPPLLAAAGVGALGDGDETAGTEDEALEAVRLLLDLGAEVNAVDDNGETALHGAAYQNRPKVVELLLDRGADISVWNNKNKAGWTPLMIAQGHRPGNFRPEPETIPVIERAMRAAGVEPPKAARDPKRHDYGAAVSR